MNITSRTDMVTLFPQGAEVTRLAALELSAGEHQLRLGDLPLALVENSLRVEGEADGELELGGVELRSVHVSREEEGLAPEERRLLETRIEKLQDEVRGLKGRLASAKTRRTMMDNLAAMPGQSGAARGRNTDWEAIYDLIGDRLPKVQEEIGALEIDIRNVRQQIDDLRGQLEDEPAPPERRYEIVVSARARTALKGRLILRYQVTNAGWQPLYDARLDTKGEQGEPLIELERRATIHQNSGEEWKDVELTLSTTRPAGGTGAPDLIPDILDILPDMPPVPVGPPPMRKLAARRWEEGEMAQAHPMPEGMEDAFSSARVVETETQVEQSGFQARFKVPGRVTLSGKGERRKVRIGGERLQARLQVRATPLLDPTAYLYAGFKLDETPGGPALLPGEVALYRDRTYVGNGRMPLVNRGERCELGFGADDAISVERVEENRSKGRHGLIKSENTDEFRFRITVRNHHPHEMPVYILERIPVSNHELLKIEELRDMSAPALRDVEGQRGVLAYEFDLAAGGEQVLTLHYRLSWPKDRQIG